MNDFLINLKGISDDRGLLVAIEGQKTVPFEIKRTYYLTNLKSTEARGFHAHKELRQFAICLKGSCLFKMDDGLEVKEFLLNSPTQGIMIEPMVWHEMHNFSLDCVLLVLASDYYDEKDYIRDYKLFKKVINEIQ